MAEERNSENFALGIIVAALVFLLLSREFSRRAQSRETGVTVSDNSPATPDCGCGGARARAPISLGGQSYNSDPYAGSTVVSVTARPAIAASGRTGGTGFTYSAPPGSATAPPTLYQGTGTGYASLGGGFLH